jgi:hypothetical protein
MSSYQHLLRIFFNLGSVLTIVAFRIVSVDQVLFFNLGNAIGYAEVWGFA